MYLTLTRKVRNGVLFVRLARNIICIGVFLYPDSKVHGANMGPTWVLSAPDGPHVSPMNLAIRVYYSGWAFYSSPCVPDILWPFMCCWQFCLRFQYGEVACWGCCYFWVNIHIWQFPTSQWLFITCYHNIANFTVHSVSRAHCTHCMMQYNAFWKAVICASCFVTVVWVVGLEQIK